LVICTLGRETCGSGAASGRDQDGFMARLPCVIAVDGPHHVTKRGNARRFILDSDTERNIYLDLLQQSLALHDVAEYLRMVGDYAGSSLSLSNRYTAIVTINQWTNMHFDPANPKAFKAWWSTARANVANL
jgi:hypothetical protein